MIALLILLLASQAAPPPELQRHVQAAVAAKQAGDVDGAIRELEAAVKIAPNFAMGHLNLGGLYAQKKDYARAVPALEKALSLQPDLPNGHALLGTALLALGYAEKALPHLEKANSKDLMGVALLEAGKPVEAIPALEAAAEASPGNPDILYYLALAHNQLSRQLFQQILAGAPDAPRAHQIAAQEFASANDTKNAIREYRAALAGRPDLRGVHLAIGELEWAAANYDEAEREFRAEIALSPGNAQALLRLGVALLNKNQLKEALEMLKRSDERKPEMPETLFELARAHTAAGNLAEAEKRLRQLLTLESNSFLAESAHFQLAGILRRTGRAAEAEKETRLFQQLREARLRRTGE